MKNITLRSDGRYMGRKQVNGQIVCVYSKTASDCITKLKRAVKDALKNPKTKKEKYYLYDWLDNWYETYKMPFIKYKSALHIESLIKKIKSKFDNVSLNDLTTNLIQQTFNKIQPSRQKELIVLYFNSALQKAEDLNLISKNPFKGVIRDRKQNNIRAGYTLNEQQSILAVIQGTQIEAPIIFYLCTGIRKNELTTFNLTKDIDKTNNIIKIKSEKKRNNNIYRYIDATPELIDFIESHKEAFNLSTDYIYRELKKLLSPLNIQTGLHRLRHTFATNHFYLGTPIKLISSWLGHETVELTQNIYTHIDRTITKEDILKLYNNLYYQV